MDLNRFNDIFKDKRDFELPTIKPYAPDLDEQDYQNGYITRYFTQKANDESSPIIEIDDRTYTNLIGNDFYLIVELDWKIEGTYDDIKEANGKSVRLASKKIPSILLYLPYLLQFSQK
jgi:hypothetical protein